MTPRVDNPQAIPLLLTYALEAVDCAHAALTRAIADTKLQPKPPGLDPGYPVDPLNPLSGPFVDALAALQATQKVLAQATVDVKTQPGPKTQAAFNEAQADVGLKKKAFLKLFTDTYGPS